MLNRFLFDSLKAAFGSVLVENEGVQAAFERDYSRGYSYEWRLSDEGQHGEQYRVNCPVCGDRKHHLYIGYLSFARPVLDGVELAQGRLLAHCFRRDCMADPQARMLLETKIRYGMACVGDGLQTCAAIGVSDESEPMYSTSDRMTLTGLRTWVPEFRWIDGDADPAILDYLAARGVDGDMVRRFRLGWGPVRSPRTGQELFGGAPCVVAPVVQNGVLAGVQARCPDPLLPEGSSMKYWIHPAMRKSAVVYNIDSARALGVGVVCEGVFDVFKVGAPGVCCFGHTPSAAQVAMLAGIDQGLVMLPDTDPHPGFDTVEEARRRCAGWNANGAFPLGAHTVVLPAKDAGDMTRQAVWETIIAQVPADMQDYLMSRVVPKL